MSRFIFQGLYVKFRISRFYNYDSRLYFKALGFNYCLHSDFKVSKLFFKVYISWFLFRLFSRPIDSKKFKQLSGQSLWDTLEYVKCRRHGDAKPFCIFDMTDLECMSMLDVWFFFTSDTCWGVDWPIKVGKNITKCKLRKCQNYFIDFWNGWIRFLIFVHALTNIMFSHWNCIYDILENETYVRGTIYTPHNTLC